MQTDLPSSSLCANRSTVFHHSDAKIPSPIPSDPEAISASRHNQSFRLHSFAESIDPVRIPCYYRLHSRLKMSSPLDVSPPTASFSNLVSRFLDPPSNLI
ncbi:hypothetical protein L2E82_39869 [Cichorium intybus]|uniref:Uncharacterized protein n=1 Tax=Cichorium intybus TaxID=13427 RepID=A0ACB9ANT1_CICIN|nr:hypothetical protein L2E82_39869 [Cichorium intybus]